MGSPELIPHLFRTEFQRIVAILCRHYGMDLMDEAEDIASSTFLAALERWPYAGIPPSPVGWLHTVARNKAINLMKRKAVFENKVRPGIAGEQSGPAWDEEPVFSETGIRDSQLLMIFSVCDPSLASEVQVALALRILCGFSVDEIASAFLAAPDTIAKRIQRGKERLRSGPGMKEHIDTKLMEQRAPMVMTTLYLLFNEGYHASSGELPVRKDLCSEAMRMTMLLLEGPWADRPEAMAMFALFCFQASRLHARLGDPQNPVSLADQDPADRDPSLISQGAWWMMRSAKGTELSKYHLEAMIAWCHVRPDAGEGKWEEILSLYDRLLALEQNPVVALNRTYALARARGKSAALREVKEQEPQRDSYGHALMGWLLEEVDPVRARSHLGEALKLARNPADRAKLRDRLSRLSGL